MKRDTAYCVDCLNAVESNGQVWRRAGLRCNACGGRCVFYRDLDKEQKRCVVDRYGTFSERHGKRGSMPRDSWKRENDRIKNRSYRPYLKNDSSSSKRGSGSVCDMVVLSGTHCHYRKIGINHPWKPFVSRSDQIFEDGVKFGDFFYFEFGDKAIRTKHAIHSAGNGKRGKENLDIGTKHGVAKNVRHIGTRECIDFSLPASSIHDQSPPWE